MTQIGDSITIPGIYPVVRIGDTVTFAGLPNTLPPWRHGVFKRIWAWIKGRDLEDRPLKRFVVTRIETAETD